MDITEKEHAKSLVELLGKKDHCLSCPEVASISTQTERLRCGLCRSFIGLPKDFTALISYRKCPCHALGAEEATKRTWIALEEKGYLD